MDSHGNGRRAGADSGTRRQHHAREARPSLLTTARKSRPAEYTPFQPGAGCTSLVRLLTSVKPVLWSIFLKFISKLITDAGSLMTCNRTLPLGTLLGSIRHLTTSVRLWTCLPPHAGSAPRSLKAICRELWLIQLLYLVVVQMVYNYEPCESSY